ncbi:hypothetical protein CL614_01765 [archaeon]|nr:hypothetical protein [archaeon]
MDDRILVVSNDFMGLPVHFDEKSTSSEITTDHPVGVIIGWFFNGTAMFLVELDGRLTSRRFDEILIKRDQ